MSDEADAAQAAQDFHLRVALLNVRGRAQAKPAAIDCEDCGAKIPEKRRQAAPGCTRCVKCQEAFEKGR